MAMKMKPLGKRKKKWQCEIIDGLLDGLEDEEIDVPLSFDYGQLARLVASGLAPRNVDAAGRGLALHNNVLVDAVFERQPLRQFEELLSTEEVVEEETVFEEEAAAYCGRSGC